MELENILSDVNQAQKAKSHTCSPSYADCRSKTDAAILWDLGHTKWGLCKGGIRRRKKTKYMNEVDVLAVQE
jgi:protein tyrosine phosphatase (PTP) superfamily phosphohydrolase (DUF442 family)